jgi:tubulin polyglutamylase TTLL2
MVACHGSICSFFPPSFILPGEYTRFVRDYTSHEDRVVWICKPNDLSRGRKIFLIRELSELHYDQQCVIQRYLRDPLLISGHKFDLRVYVLVSSARPLRVHLYREGLARFSVVAYDAECEDMGNLFSHLTNASVQRGSALYGSDKPGIGEGSKWTFAELRGYFRARGVDFEVTWAAIRQLVNLTVLSVAHNIAEDTTRSCFEVFGFDILLDSKMKPWLLEVNMSPALGVDCEADRVVKEGLIADTVEVLEAEAAGRAPPPRAATARARPSQPPPRPRLGSSVLPRVTSMGSITSAMANPIPGASTSTAAIPMTGKYELIFPFNDATEVVSRGFCAGSVDIKRAVEEIKKMRN